MVFEQSVSIIIITRNRPHMVRDCLEHLRQQTVAPDEVIVVDSSSNDATQSVLDEYPEVRRLRILNARNNRPQAYSLGVANARSVIIAFLDDDSMAQPDWLRCLLEPYADPSVGGVGGRVIDALEQSRARPDDPRIGVIQPDGKMTTNFILDPGRPVEVDHMRGCNMSFRRAALERIGEFDSRYIGNNLCVETDVCLRIKQAGWKLIYQPSAVVNHLAAPREEMTRGLGRIEPRAVLWDAHNRAYLLFKNFGYNYWTAKNILGGRQLLFLKLLLREPSWRRARAAVLYGVGAWWGLADSIVRRVHLIRLGG